MTNFKDKLNNTADRLSSHIVTVPSAAVSQAMAAAGADSLILDMEHGAIDYASAHAMIAATNGFDCAPLVRVAKTDDWHVKRALDLGAEGIVFPLVNSAQDVEKAVKTLRYPPNGTRGFGPFIAHSHENVNLLDYAAKIDGTRTCCILVETADAVENIEEICEVSGIDLIIPAQFDLSTSLGIHGQFDNPIFLQAVAKIEKAALAANIPLGGVTMTKQQADALFTRGYRLVAGFDLLMLKAKTAEIQSWCEN
jgi:4-hydroxy-2-oxoheptanedioate aldolase